MSTRQDASGRTADAVFELDVRRSYSAAFQVTVAASATDIAVIGGSASKAVNVRKLSITAVQTTAGYVDVLLVKRAAADSAGTPVGITEVAHDSQSPAPTAVVTAYTANPTINDAGVAVRREHVFVPAPAGTAGDGRSGFDFSPIALRGIAQQLAINLAGVTIAGGIFNVNIEWDEE
jgi:hypothetical protein